LIQRDSSFLSGWPLLCNAHISSETRREREGEMKQTWFSLGHFPGCFPPFEWCWTWCAPCWHNKRHHYVHFDWFGETSPQMHYHSSERMSSSLVCRAQCKLLWERALFESCSLSLALSPLLSLAFRVESCLSSVSIHFHLVPTLFNFYSRSFISPPWSLIIYKKMNLLILCADCRAQYQCWMAPVLFNDRYGNLWGAVGQALGHSPSAKSHCLSDSSYGSLHSSSSSSCRLSPTSYQIKCYLSHEPNTTGVDFTVKCSLTSASQRRRV
jgi:hypothetical protein